MQSSWQAPLGEARFSLDRWDLVSCRTLAARARSLAASWGASEGVALADILVARASLLVTAQPAGLVLPKLDAPPISIAASELRFRAELQAAQRSGTPPELPSLGADAPDDAIAAAAIIGSELFAVLDRAPPRIAGAVAVRDRAAGGWQHLVTAISAEASGASGYDAVQLALEQAEASDNRALSWTALRLRAAICRRRGAAALALETDRRMRALVESWALTLPALDARAALERPDRAALRAPEPVVRDDASLLVDVALALAHERDANRLTEIALESAVTATHAERGLLLLAEGSSGFRVAAAHHADGGPEELLGLSSSIARRALAAREVIASDDVRSDPRLGECASIAIDVTSVLCVPILARDEVEGALYLDRRRRGRAFDQGAVDAARAIGSMLAAALLNARVIHSLELKAEALEAAQERLAELLAERTVQRDDAERQLADTRGEEHGLVGRGPALTRLRKTIERVAIADAPVLVIGETGAGKELVARAVHAASARRERPFVALNCGAMSENLLEAELFGAERGAYTGANVARPGLFVAAHGGTLFLDEVGDMPPAMQIALLRALETSEIRPVGATRTRSVDVRVIAATQTDLHLLEAEGKFRSDLRYRLEVLRIEVPALREHLDDLPELAEYLLEAVRHQYSLPHCRLSRDALDALSRRAWRGNVRELRHVLANAALAAAGPTITAADLPEERGAAGPRPFPEPPRPGEDGHQLRVDAVRGALRATAGHRGRAAKLLGISRSTFYRYLELYGIDPSEFDVASAKG